MCYSIFLKTFSKFKGMHQHRRCFFFPTYNLQLYWKIDAGIYSFLWVLQNFLETPLFWKTSCELVLKGEFYEKWLTDILIIIKRYLEVDISFKKQTLRGKVDHLKKVDTELNSNFQLHHRYFFSKLCY